MGLLDSKPNGARLVSGEELKKLLLGIGVEGLEAGCASEILLGRDVAGRWEGSGTCRRRSCHCNKFGRMWFWEALQSWL